MKKILLITCAFAMAKLAAQPLPNGTFENWTSIAYSDPTGFSTGNSRDIPRMGIPSVTKVTGFSGFAVRIQNNVVGADTSDSYMINTNNPCSDPPQWTGGVPYSQQPTAITGKVRYNLAGNDTAILLVIFRKNGAHIGDNVIKIRGTGSQSTFTSFSYTVACAGVPDSLIIAAAPSDKIANISNAGSFIEFDNLAFTGATQPIPNGDFESWTAKTFDAPNGWNASEMGVSKSSSSYAGLSAVRLETMNQQCGGANPGVVTTGTLSHNGGPKGGRPYTNMMDTLCGYYKYTSVGGSVGSLFINLSKNGNNIGGTTKQFTASANYVFFQIPFSAGQTPDTIRIDIQSANWPVSASNLGSVLYVDNLFFKSAPLGIFENTIDAGNVFAFPNPANSVLNITSNKNMQAKSVTVYNANGQVVMTQNAFGTLNQISVNVESLAKGLYYYEINTQTGIVRNKFIKE